MRLDALGLGNVIAHDVRAVAAPTLSEATQQYLQLKGMGKAKTFHQAALRNAGTVIEIYRTKKFQDTKKVNKHYDYYLSISATRYNRLR